MGSAFAQPSNLDFTWAELCKAAITVGRRNWEDVLKFGTYSGLDILWRVAMVRANLREDPNTGRLHRSDVFDALDRSEKGAVSYFLGMCFAKLALEKLFRVRWLLHLDVYNASLNGYLAFNTRPDLVGLDARQQWTVVEAKGRSWGMPDDTMTTAKRQTRSLRRINDQFPALRVAVGSGFFSEGIKTRIWDPEDYDDDAPDVPIDPEVFLKAYYRPLIEYAKLLQSQPYADAQTGRRRRSVELAGFDATLLIDDDIVASYEQNASIWQRTIVPRAATEDSILAEIAVLRHASEESEDAASGRLVQIMDRSRATGINEVIDGVTVKLGDSWDTEYMNRQPRDRGR
jgi:hypothetical protein